MDPDFARRVALNRALNAIADAKRLLEEAAPNDRIPHDWLGDAEEYISTVLLDNPRR